jgi:hypothetical protein
MKLRSLAVSLLIAIVLILAEYVFDNMGHPILDELEKLGVVEYVMKSNKGLPYDEDSLVLINVGCDKALAYMVEDGDTLGTVDVTNREELIHLFRVAKDSHYKYLFADIRFPKEVQSNYDKELYDLMAQMPRFSISTHADVVLADSRLAKVAGYADYGTTLTTGFSRYQLLQNDKPSVALKMYQEIDGGDLKRYGPIFAEGWKLSFNCIFVPVPSTLVTAFDSDNIEAHMRLGSQLFRYETDDEIRNMMKDKIVIVGDFDNDVHSTYAGNIPGAILNFISYLQVKEGHHHFNFLLWLPIFLFYVAVCYILITAPKSESKLMSFFIWLITWSVVLKLICVIYYAAFSILIITTIPSLCFTFIPKLAFLKNLR